MYSNNRVGVRYFDLNILVLHKADPKYPRFRMLRTIEANQVVAVESGIYFIEPLLKQLQQGKHRNVIDWGLVEQLRPCGGIRIEGNAVITEDGPQNLTRISM